MILRTLLISVSTILCLTSFVYSQNTPSISSFAPTTGPIGSTITVNGDNFDEVLNNNAVFFGSSRAEITRGTTTELEVMVPAGANYAPLTVLVNDLIAYAPEPFVVTFESEGIVESSYDAKVDFSAGIDPTEIALGDFDDDGKTDVIVLNRADNNLSIFRNTTINPGQISYDTKIDFGTGLRPISLALGDLDGDGKTDIAVANYDDNTVTLFHNRSTGAGSISYSQGETLLTGVQPRFVAIGDFDLDGKPDLTVVNDGSHTVSVYRNTSTGPGVISYADRSDFSTGFIPKCVAVGDLDLDGKVDLVVANWNSNTISIFRNQSTGAGDISYDTRLDYFVGLNPLSIAIGDLDEDGMLDLAVTNFNGNSMSIFRNVTTDVGSISYAEKLDYLNIPGPSSISMNDFDGDGRIDLVVPNRSINVLSVFRNIGTTPETIEYAPRIDFPTALAPFSATSGDIDGDGRTDIAVVNFVDNSWSIFRNTNTQTDFTEFSFSEQTNDSDINAGSHTIDIEVSRRADLVDLISTFSLSDQATARLGSIDQSSGVTANDFSSQVTYTVVAGDKITMQDWIINVAVEPNEKPVISSATFSVDEQSPLGTFVGQVEASDANGDQLTFSILSGNESEPFQIDDITGELTVLTSSSLNFSAKNRFDLEVEVSDGELKGSALITINLNALATQPLGIDDAPGLWKVYPNPFSDQLVIEWPELKYVIIQELTGRELLKTTKHELSMSNFPKGVYIVTLLGTGGKQVKSKIIKN